MTPQHAKKRSSLFSGDSGGGKEKEKDKKRDKRSDKKASASTDDAAGPEDSRLGRVAEAGLAGEGGDGAGPATASAASDKDGGKATGRSGKGGKGADKEAGAAGAAAAEVTMALLLVSTQRVRLLRLVENRRAPRKGPKHVELTGELVKQVWTPRPLHTTMPHIAPSAFS